MDMFMATITGNLGRDPEFIDGTNDYDGFVSMNVAVNSDARYDEPEWVSVSVWGKLADNCLEYLTKGRKVAVTGRLVVDTFTRKSGEEGFALRIKATDVIFLPSGQGDDERDGGRGGERRSSRSRSSGSSGGGRSRSRGRSNTDGDSDSGERRSSRSRSSRNRNTDDGPPPFDDIPF